MFDKSDAYSRQVFVSHSVTASANEIWLPAQEIKAREIKTTWRLNFNTAVIRIKGAVFKAMSHSQQTACLRASLLPDGICQEGRTKGSLAKAGVHRQLKIEDEWWCLATWCNPKKDVVLKKN